MRTKIYLLGLLITGSALSLPAQNNSASPKDSVTITLDNLRTPTSPGFVLLGVEPSSIERPTTPRGLSASLLSAAGLSGIKPNYSLEFAPYWLKSNPDLTFDEYYSKKNVGRNIAQSFSLSLATAETNIQNGVPGTGMGFGFRTQLFSGKPAKEIEEIRKEKDQLRFLVVPANILLILEQSLENDQKDAPAYSKAQLIVTLTKEVERIRSKPATFSVLKNISTEKINELLDNFSKAITDSLSKKTFTTKEDALNYLKVLERIYTESEAVRSLRKRISESDKDKIGFVWELAGAGMVNFPGNRYDLSYFTKAGFWTTLGYKLPSQKFDALFTTRYLYNSPVIDSLDHFDVGGSIVWHIKKGIALEGEFIARNSYRIIEKSVQEDIVSTSVQYKKSTRYSFNFEYKLNDYIYLTSTFGKNFDDTKGKGQNLISLFGINYNLNNLQQIKL